MFIIQIWFVFVSFILKNISNSIFLSNFIFFLQIVVTTATMGKNNELTAEQRGAIFYLRKNGNSYNQISETVGCGKTTVYDN